MSNAPGQRKLQSSDRTARSAVERALAELRRGAGVVLVDDDNGSGAIAVAAAECARGIADFMEKASSVPDCVIPATRAAALALDTSHDGNVAIVCRGGAAMTFDPELARAIAGLNDDLALPTNTPVAAADPMRDAAVGLVKLARLLPAAIVARITDDPAGWAAREDALILKAADVRRYRDLVGEGDTVLAAQAAVPLEGAEDTEVYAFRPADGGKEHLAIVIGDPARDQPVLARLHSECLTGDLLGSLRCDCGDQLRGAIQAIAADGGGILLYLAQEGRGIGLVNKLRAYRLQNAGYDTIDANERLGFGADERVYRPAATILHSLGFDSVRLLTNNPAKVQGLAACGVEVVERVPHSFPANGHNETYLRTKAARAGHLL
jgi:GTP cyclohydrolase II